MCELRMFLRIVGARSAQQFDIIDIIDIIEVKIPFDLNIISSKVYHIVFELTSICPLQKHYRHMHLFEIMSHAAQCIFLKP